MLDYCTINGAKAIGMSDKLGSIEKGKYADVVILGGKAPNMRPLLLDNIVANIAYSASSLNVKTVFCQGDMVVEDGRILTLDMPEVLDASEQIWKQLCLRE